MIEKATRFHDRLRALVLLVWLCAGSFAPLTHAQSLPAQMAEASQTSKHFVAQPQDPTVVPGMPVETAIALLGREPDLSQEIGAACGMLEIMTWQDENVRLVTTGGSVTSVGANDPYAKTEP